MRKVTSEDWITALEGAGATGTGTVAKELSFLTAQGYTSGTLDDRWYQYLKAKGYTGGLQDMWQAAEAADDLLSAPSYTGPLLVEGATHALYIADAAYLKQLSGGTTSVANGDPVGYWADQSGNDNHLLQSTTANKPTFNDTEYPAGILTTDGGDWMSCIGGSALMTDHTGSCELFIAMDHGNDAGVFGGARNLFNIRVTGTGLGIGVALESRAIDSPDTGEIKLNYLGATNYLATINAPSVINQGAPTVSRTSVIYTSGNSASEYKELNNVNYGISARNGWGPFTATIEDIYLFAHGDDAVNRGHWANAGISALAVYNRALTAGEKAAVYTAMGARLGLSL